MSGLFIAESSVDMNALVEVGNDSITLVDQIVFSVMVSAKYGLNVPFELTMRIVNFDASSGSLFQALNRASVIQWHEYSQIEFQLGARTAIEAKILTNLVGRKKRGCLHRSATSQYPLSRYKLVWDGNRSRYPICCSVVK